MTASEKFQEILSNSLTAVTQGGVLPEPDTVPHCLVRTFKAAIEHYLQGEGPVQVELAHLIARARNWEDELVSLLKPDERIAMGTFLKMLQSARASTHGH